MRQFEFDKYFALSTEELCAYTQTVRVTTCLENLELSGNLTAVREM